MSTLVLMDFQYFFHLSSFILGLMHTLDSMLDSDSDKWRLLSFDSDEEASDNELLVDTDLCSLEAVSSLLGEVGLDGGGPVLTVDVLLSTLVSDLLLDFVAESLSKTW